MKSFLTIQMLECVFISQTFNIERKQNQQQPTTRKEKNNNNNNKTRNEKEE